MSRLRVLRISAAALLGGMLALAGCAASPGSAPPSSSDAPAGQSLGSLAPAPPEAEVVGEGTVIDVDGTVEVCLGPVAESYPPQCSGLPLRGWAWDDADGAKSSGSVRWGQYALTGTYDGSALTLTGAPVPLALYDPPARTDPTGGEPGSTPESELTVIQDELPDRLGSTGYLASYPEDGRVWVDVLWDDGTLQRAADDDYGAGVVIVRSALRPAAL
ncbi:hypothetical protein [Microbacterium paludicola]|uniref:hypothetical protein n=1 Tax=Microbacterium paludicola TaxID=300019 RepID=UPI0011A6A39E|nr:hypothetical protein [Microbacterium paludicola]